MSVLNFIEIASFKSTITVNLKHVTYFAFSLTGFFLQNWPYSDTYIFLTRGDMAEIICIVVSMIIGNICAKYKDILRYRV